ncbi:MAG: ferritin family protein [Candidatus Margulisiibacteriota bacterium]|nr:ferritin family protein [Candidatus Margulisiibacteriota bacterium]
MADIRSDTKMAIQLEQEGYDIYVNAAAKTTNALARTTFLGIAEREKTHIERIKRLYADLLGDTVNSKWIDEVSGNIDKGAIIRPILVNLKDNLDRQGDQIKQDFSKIYDLALTLEKNTYDLYKRLSEDPKNEEEIRKFYAALAQEETLHFQIFQETLKYLNNPEDFYHLEERWIIEG